MHMYYISPIKISTSDKTQSDVQHKLFVRNEPDYGAIVKDNSTISRCCIVPSVAIVFVIGGDLLSSLNRNADSYHCWPFGKMSFVSVAIAHQIITLWE